MWAISYISLLLFSICKESDNQNSCLVVYFLGLKWDNPKSYFSVCIIVVENLLANVGDRRDVGQEYPPEKEMANHSIILACRMLWTEEPGGL